MSRNKTNTPIVSNAEPQAAAFIEQQMNEIIRLHDAIGRAWQALGIEIYTGKAVWEHVAELKAELAATKEELAETKRRYEEWKQVQFVMAAVAAAQGEGKG